MLGLTQSAAAAAATAGAADSNVALHEAQHLEAEGARRTAAQRMVALHVLIHTSRKCDSGCKNQG